MDDGVWATQIASLRATHGCPLLPRWAYSYPQRQSWPARCVERGVGRCGPADFRLLAEKERNRVCSKVVRTRIDIGLPPPRFFHLTLKNPVVLSNELYVLYSAAQGRHTHCLGTHTLSQSTIPTDPDGYACMFEHVCGLVC